MSPWWNSCSTPSRFARLPAYVSLSRTTTSSPRRGEAPGEVRADEAGAAGDENAHRRQASCPQPREALAQALAPVRQLRRALLAAQHRVGGPRRLRAELGGRDPPHAAVEARLLEDRLGEVGPRAVAGGGDVVDAERQLEHRRRRLREMADVGRAAALVVDDRDLVALGAEPQHRAHEVVRRRAEEPRGAHDPRLLAGRRLAVQLRAAVDAERRRRVRLEVRLALRAVEDVVASRSTTSGAPSSAACCAPPTLTAAAPCGSSSAPSTSVQAAACRTSRRLRLQAGRRRERDVPVGARQRARLGKRLGERVAELPARAGDQDAAAVSRSERSGDRVLQRSTTRGSFQGTPCSSGSRRRTPR